MFYQTENIIFIFTVTEIFIESFSTNIFSHTFLNFVQYSLTVNIIRMFIQLQLLTLSLSQCFFAPLVGF